jgi:hypothetical protein
MGGRFSRVEGVAVNDTEISYQAAPGLAQAAEPLSRLEPFFGVSADCRAEGREEAVVGRKEEGRKRGKQNDVWVWEDQLSEMR